MKPVLVPEEDLPPNVKRVQFSPPEGAENLEPIIGLVHLDEKGQQVGMEFMFELTKEEKHTIKHEPYVTLLIHADHLHPFSLQTTFPYEDKYKDLDTHTHVCTHNITHEKNRWWQCDNVNHKGSQDRSRICYDCLNSEEETDA